MDNFFTYLANSGLTTVLVIIGALFLLIAIGNIEEKIQISKFMRLILGLLGISLIFLGIISGLREGEKKSQLDTISPDQRDTPTIIHIETPQQENLRTPTPNVKNLSNPTTTVKVNIDLPRICGSESFFEQSHYSTSPLFMRPANYSSGWITSDASNIILPDGSKQPIFTRYVLIVNDLPEVQFQNVAIGSNKHANIWGCWYSEDSDFQSIVSDAEFEFDKMKSESPESQIGFFELSKEGLKQIER